MRICDVDRKSEVKHEKIGLCDLNDPDSEAYWDVELGEPAYTALMHQDWAALAAMQPREVSWGKNPNRVAGAQKAHATRAAKKAAAKQAEGNVSAGATTAGVSVQGNNIGLDPEF